MEALDSYGLTQLCSAIMDGKSLTFIADEAGSSLTRLLAWIGADAERSARVREARQAMAKVWDEKAEQRIESALDEFGLKKAKELAHHYRWRSAKVSPLEYGDKVSLEHAGPGGGPVAVALDTSKLSDAALQELLNVRRAETDGG